MIRLILLSALVFSSYTIPIAIFHGVGDQCSNTGMKNFVTELAEGTTSYASCIEVGNGAESSWVMDFKDQAQQACENLKSDTNFKGEIAVVGLSQGALQARSIIEDCQFEGKVVKFLSIGGPQMGVSAMPHCSKGIFCKPINALTKSMIYQDSIQSHVGPAGYFRDPKNIDKYLKSSHFLADLNNERNYSEEKRTKFTSLQGAMLVKFLSDTMIYPKETSWFQTLDENGDLEDLQKSSFYMNDLIGLKQLNEAKKVKFVAIDGDHLKFSKEDINGTFIPFLIE